MHQPASSKPRLSRSSPPPSLQPRLHGIWLLFARVGWLIMVLFLVVFFLANLPVYFAQLQQVCLHPHCTPWQLTPTSANTLQQLHFSARGYALVILIISVTSVCVWFAVAAVIFWRQSRRGIALLMSLLLVVQGVIQMSGAIPRLEYSNPGWQRVTVLVETLDSSLVLLVFSLFPTGRFAPGWMRWLVAVLTVALWSYVFGTSASVSWEALLTPLTLGVFAGVMGSIIGAQIYRYRRVSTWAERQQTKWVLLGMVEGPLVGVLYALLPLVFPLLSQPGSLYFMLAQPTYNLLFLFAPLSIGIALLRYQLWDIDRLINKALVYGSLTVLLGACYAGLIIGLESLASTITGFAAQPMVLVLSTLVIAALFLPVRRLIQTTIDRRFYRNKYDAEKTLAAFSATLRNEVDLEQVREQFIAVVQETMQPTHVSLWLRPPDSPHAAGDPAEYQRAGRNHQPESAQRHQRSGPPDQLRQEINHEPAASRRSAGEHDSATLHG